MHCVDSHGKLAPFRTGEWMGVHGKWRKGMEREEGGETVAGMQNK